MRNLIKTLKTMRNGHKAVKIEFYQNLTYYIERAKHYNNKLHGRTFYKIVQQLVYLITVIESEYRDLL